MGKLAGLHQNQQVREKQAEALYLKIQKIQTRTLGTEHPEILTFARNLAEALKKQGRFEEAERMHRQTLASWDSFHGKEQPDTLSSKEILAETLRV